MNKQSVKKSKIELQRKTGCNWLNDLGTGCLLLISLVVI